MTWRPLLLGCLLAVTACATEDDVALEASSAAVLDNPQNNAVFVPADYDGDGFTDLAVKDANGTWYLDVASCDVFGPAETACNDYLDDDLDGLINDGCPAVGAPETLAASYACEPDFYSSFDEDHDGYLNDGCPANRQCQGANGFDDRWDFAFRGYGGAGAQPVPADYGSVAGPADGKADLAVKDTSGVWAIDYADNGFGTFDVYLTGYGLADAVPWPADYDGDGRADLSVRSTSGNGAWYFDYSSDGFGAWNKPCTGGCPCVVPPGPGYPVLGYGLAADTPAPGDFDGDGCADLSVKDQAGRWYFDLAKNGFTGWEAPCPTCASPLTGYGDSSVKPIVADYDSNGTTDLAVMTPDGHWGIDFADDGFGTWNTWPFYHSGWGGAGTRLVPGHYFTNQGLVDMAVKTPSGWVYLDGAANGYNQIDASIHSARQLLDTTQPWIDRVDFTRPSTTSCGNGVCDPTLGESSKTCVQDCVCSGEPSACDPGGNFREVPATPTALKIGVRYTAGVHLQPGSAGAIATAVQENPDLRIPPWLNVANIGGHGISMNNARVVYPHSRRFGFTCSQWGSFPLGFGFTTGVNADYGERVICTSDHAGLYGTVTNKRTGMPVVGALIVAGGASTSTDSLGQWKLTELTGGPHTVSISRSGFAPAVAVNVQVPAYPAKKAGVQIDTPLEEAFNLPTGITYTTYIDYSRGRSILHTVRIDTTRAPLTMGKAGVDTTCSKDAFGCGGCWEGPGSDFRRLLDVASSQNAPVMINGIWWTLPGVGANRLQDPGNLTDCSLQAGPAFADTRPIGYLYLNGFSGSQVCAGGVCRFSEVECGIGRYFAEPGPGERTSQPVLQQPWTTPLLGISGSGTSQRAKIVMTPTDFLREGGPWENQLASRVPGCPSGQRCPIYDENNNDRSDFTYAMQMGYSILLDGGTTSSQVIARGVITEVGTGYPSEWSFARTTAGTNAAGTVVWFVVADGEGIDGGGGATPNQMAVFYRDVLGARNAMMIDSGESTEMILRGAGGPRRVNVVTSENHAGDGWAPDGDYCPNSRVFAYLKAGG